MADDTIQLLYGCDESNGLAARVNAGSKGDRMDIVVYRQASGSNEGLAPIADDRGGKALDMRTDPTGLQSSSGRYGANAVATNDVIASTLAPAGIAQVDNEYLWTPNFEEIFDGVTVGNALSYGFRFKLDSAGTQRDSQFPFGYWGLSNTAYPGDGVEDGPWSSGAGIYLTFGPQIVVDWASSPVTFSVEEAWLQTTGGGHGQNWSTLNFFTDVGVANGWDAFENDGDGKPYEADVWYRFLWTAYQIDDGGTISWVERVYIYNETNGEKYVLQKDTISPVTAQTSTLFHVGADGSWEMFFAAGTPFSSGLIGAGEGNLDEIWLRSSFVDFDEAEDIIVNGIDIPWTAPDPETLANRVRVASTNERTAFPPTRPLPTGATAVDHPAGSYGTRPRIRYEGYEPNRPWDISSIEMLFDSAGRRRGKMGNRFTWDDFRTGLVRQPGHKKPGTMADVRNMEFSGLSVRRRRGFEVKNTDGYHSDRGSGGFASWRNTDDELHRVVLTGGTLYRDIGESLTAISTGWSEISVPSFAQFRDRLVVLDHNKQVLWDGQTEGPLVGEYPPSSGSASLTAGTLTGDYYYGYTFYDPLTGDETAPWLFSGPQSPTVQGVSLTSLDTTVVESRFTQQRIYRTVSGGAAPDLFLTAVQAIATSYLDSGDTNGTIQIGQVKGEYLSLQPPDEFEFAVAHAGRIFYAGGDDGDRVYRSEAGTCNQFSADAYTAHQGAIRAIASRGPQLVVWTDHTVEVVESDWIRDSNGATFETITVISNVVGAPSHGSIVDANDEIYWLDARGIYTLQGDKVVMLSQHIEGWTKLINWGRKSHLQGAWNFADSQVIWTLAHAAQDNNLTQNTQLVYQTGQGQISLYDMNAAFLGVYDDDLDGLKFGILDEYGVWKEFGTYESDGVEEVGAKHTGTALGIGITGTLTDVLQDWTVDEFQGYGIVVVHRDTGAFTYRTIKSNTATVLQFDTVLGNDHDINDAYYIGGIPAWFELAEAHMGTSNRKISRQLHTELTDLTRNDNR